MKLTHAAFAFGLAVIASAGCGGSDGDTSFGGNGGGGSGGSSTGGAAGNAAGGAAGSGVGGAAGNAAGGSTATGGSTGTGGGTSCAGADPGPCGNDGTTWPAASQAFECKVIEILNEKRKAGLMCGSTWAPGGPALTRDKDLTANARAHSELMAQNASVTFDEDGTPAGDWSMKNYCGKYITAEIGGGQSDPSTFILEQLNVPSECMKLMATGAKGVGVGYKTDATGTSVHMWTLVLGNLP